MQKYMPGVGRRISEEKASVREQETGTFTEEVALNGYASDTKDTMSKDTDSQRTAESLFILLQVFTIFVNCLCKVKAQGGEGKN